jgi:hypothetical protein
MGTVQATFTGEKWGAVTVTGSHRKLHHRKWQTTFYWKDFPIQYYLGTHNIQSSVTPQRIWFLQADDNLSTNTLDFNQYTINSGEPYRHVKITNEIHKLITIHQLDIILNIFISWYDHWKTDVHSETFQNLYPPFYIFITHISINNRGRHIRFPFV